MPTQAPPEYTPQYCDAVKANCARSMDEQAQCIQEVHTAIFQPDTGILARAQKNIPYSSLKWWMGLLLVPMIIAVLTLYGFYIRAPLTYADRDAVQTQEKRIIGIEKDLVTITKAVQELPDKEDFRKLLNEGLHEHGLTKSMRSLEVNPLGGKD